MAGKSSRGRNKKASQTVTTVTKATEPVVLENGHSKDEMKKPVGEQKVEGNEVFPSVEVRTAEPEVVKEAENGTSENQAKQGEILFSNAA